MEISTETDAAPFLQSLWKAVDLLQSSSMIERGMRRAGEIYLTAMQERFIGNSFGYGDWEPLAPSTVREKARKGYPAQINIRTFALYDSLTPGKAGNIFDVSGAELTMGTSIDYAVYVQAKRPFLVPPNDETMTAMIDAIASGGREALQSIID